MRTILLEHHFGIKKSAFGAWLAKNSSPAACKSRTRILGARSKQAGERKMPSSRCGRGPGETLAEECDWEKFQKAKMGDIPFLITC